ncbi:MAG: Tpl protein [Candidatus Cloacimonetes bacterium]|nr:Tpl protein [Candidatus Cloacimonadota bacterium]
MNGLIEVKFKCDEKRYYENPHDIEVRKGQYVIVEAEKGADLGCVGNYPLDREKLELPDHYTIRKIIREASDDDIEKMNRIHEKEADAREKFLNALKDQPFEMDLVDVEYQFDGNKLTFYFMAETRVDFRDFLKVLARIFRTRIELRQINERQEIKRLGGIGPCGRELCCKNLNLNFDRVTIQMAKDQNVSVTSSKMCGLCGKLLCCLAYEEEFYKEEAEKYPEIGEEIEFNNKKMTVEKNNFLTLRIELRDENGVLTTISFDDYLEDKIKKKKTKFQAKITPKKNKRQDDE